MARLNIDDSIFQDPRFLELVLKIGDYEKALGRLVLFWSAAQRSYAQGSKLKQNEANASWRVLVDVGLAEERENGLYAKGAEKHFGWLKERREAAKAGGKQSAIARSSKTKQKQPNATKSNPLTLTLTHISSPNGEGEKISPRPESLFEIWNAHRGPLARATTLNDTRRRKAKARWSEMPDADYWTSCVKKMAASAFCAESKWANFDWLMANDLNHVKVSEGKYDGQKSPAPRSTREAFQNFVKGEPSGSGE